MAESFGSNSINGECKRREEEKEKGYSEEWTNSDHKLLFTAVLSGHGQEMTNEKQEKRMREEWKRVMLS